MSSLLFSPNIFTPVWFFLNMTKPLGRQCRPFCFHQKFSRKIESTRHEINNPATTLGTTMSSLLDQLLIFPWQIYSSQFYRNKKKPHAIFIFFIHLLLQFDTTITKLIPHSTRLSPLRTFFIFFFFLCLIFVNLFCIKVCYYYYFLIMFVNYVFFIYGLFNYCLYVVFVLVRWPTAAAAHHREPPPAAAHRHHHSHLQDLVIIVFVLV